MAFEDPPADAGGGYDYVQPDQPAEAAEGESWYDSDANEAFVYDGANWLELTVLDHGELSGVSASDHHTRYSDSEARTAVDGSDVSITGDADTVDNQHAADLATSASDQGELSESRSVEKWYQNTTGGPLMVTITLNDPDTWKAKYHVNSSQNFRGVAVVKSGSTPKSVTLCVPENHYYHVEVTQNSPSVSYWHEVTLA
jgi:hypothetical protein